MIDLERTRQLFLAAFLTAMETSQAGETLAWQAACCDLRLQIGHRRQGKLGHWSGSLTPAPSVPVETSRGNSSATDSVRCERQNAGERK